MLIENPDAFKTWLTSILEPLCDADPAALAKYVYALVKKDKPLEELRDGMLDQLDVFLQQETKPFVELLFKALDTHEYLSYNNGAPQTAAQLELAQPAAEANHDEQEPSINGTCSLVEESRGGAPVPARSHPPPVTPRHRVVLNRAPPVKHAAPAPRQYDPALAKMGPLSELLEEPLDQPPRRRDRRTESLKDKDDRRRRRSRSRSWERGRRAPRRHPPAWRNSSPPHAPHLARHDKRRASSRSPSPVPRGRYRNRSPPPAPPASAPARGSRSRSRSPLAPELIVRDRVRERARSWDHDRDHMSRDRDHRERMSREHEWDRERDRSRDRSRGSAGTPTQDSNPGDPPAFPPSGFHKRRCRDFDEKGYCMRGDLCQWDHGTDPVVLEDAALSRVLTVPVVPEYNPLAPDIWSGGPPPPLPGFPPYPPPHHPPRELIPIPRIRGAALAGGPPRLPLLAPLHAAHQAVHPHLHHHKKPFDYSRLGGARPGGANCTLEVKKVPHGMNDITHLNNHFSKFGRIVNIQVCYEGSPEAALITFSSHTEANVAYKSTEAVLNNRFIKVFWHNPESKQENVPPSGTNPSGNKTSAPERPPPHVNPPSHAGSHNKVLINKDNMKATADSKVAAANAVEKAKESGNKPVGEVKPTAADKQKQVQDMRRRAYTLLQTQLVQQKLLIEKLEKGDVTGAQRTALMEAIKTAQEGIEKLQKELLTYPKSALASQGEAAVTQSLGRLRLSQGGAVVKKLRTREEAQKEILDMELDLFTKQQEGQDVSELMKKVSELRRQQTMLSYPQSVHAVPRRPPTRGARYGGNTRYSLRAGAAAATPPGGFNNQSVDHRPRALLVSGFEADEVEAVVQHFAQYGEIVNREVNSAVPELVLQFRARPHAELAAARAKNYNDRTLSITWTSLSKPATPAVTPAPVSAEDVEPAPPGASPTYQQPSKEPEVVVDMSEEALLHDDEDDDEDEERSWRR